MKKKSIRSKKNEKNEKKRKKTKSFPKFCLFFIFTFIFISIEFGLILLHLSILFILPITFFSFVNKSLYIFKKSAFKKEKKIWAKLRWSP
jgi:uncharacterized membrane protein YadS